MVHVIITKNHTVLVKRVCKRACIVKKYRVANDFYTLKVSMCKRECKIWDLLKYF